MECLRRLAVLLLVVGLLASRADAHNCSSACTANSDCTMNCTEADLRAAVALANACSGTPSFSRVLSFNTPNCVIAMQQTVGSAVPTSSTCGTDTDRYAVCLTGHHITIDGHSNTTFRYAGTAKCQSACTGATCPVPPNQPALFTLKGHHNSIRNLKMDYFQEGIHLRSGDAHTVAGLTSFHFCDDALTVESGATTPS